MIAPFLDGAWEFQVTKQNQRSKFLVSIRRKLFFGCGGGVVVVVAICILTNQQQDIRMIVIGLSRKLLSADSNSCNSQAILKINLV